MKFILEYVWLDGHSKLRSKYKTVEFHKIVLADLPTWNYDGSSTHQASTHDSEISLLPVAYYNNPFLKNSFLVLCETYKDDKPTATNHRHLAYQYFLLAKNEPWFGIEQEYFMMNPDSTVPLAFDNNFPEQQGNYYCGVGLKNRDMAEKHYLYCLEAGLNISGINAEVAPSQWEYQIGPCTGIECADQLWISRYILQKVGEMYGIPVSFCPKPMPYPWNGSGLHTNFSTRETRSENGIHVIVDYMSRLQLTHKEHLEVYGDNSLRLSGNCETSDPSTFSWGYGNRSCSIRIPNQVIQSQCGYFEDRRPASDADPYQVTSILFKTCCL